VINDIPSDCIVSGNPAKIVRKINDNDEKEITDEKMDKKKGKEAV